MTVHIQRKPGALLVQTLRIRGHQFDTDGSTVTIKAITVERAT